MTAITATPNLARRSVTLTVTAAVGAFAVTAEPLGRDAYTVRTFGAPTSAPFDDLAAPFGIPITYRVIEAGVTTATVRLDSLDVRGSILSSTVDPSLSIAATIVTDQPHEWQARSAYFDVIARPDPLVAVDVMRYRSGTWAFLARTQTERRDLIALMRTGHPVMLRTSSPTVVDDAIALPLTLTETPLVDETGARVFTVEYQAVTREQGPYAGTADWTYNVLASTRATYAAVLTEFATYSALFTGPVPAIETRRPNHVGASWRIVL
jgi:hypothetical protein